MSGTRGKKRARTEAEEEQVATDAPPSAEEEAPAAEPPVENNNVKADNEDGDDEDDAPLVSNYKMSRAVCNGHECPYLDSISRQARAFS
jgi:hypothetical protein